MTKQKRRHGRLMIVSGARNASTNTAFLYGRHFSHAPEYQCESEMESPALQVLFSGYRHTGG